MTRVNDRIRVPEVRVIDENGNQAGIMRTDEALAYAHDRDLDLVEVAPDAKPPVCRVLDYSKYKYEQAQKKKAARKHQTTVVVREIKLRPKIAPNDYNTKKGHIKRFLLAKQKVKVTIMFRGREVVHPERGRDLLDKVVEELGDVCQLDQRANLEGRNMIMLLSPSKSVLNGTYKDPDNEEPPTEEELAQIDESGDEVVVEDDGATAAEVADDEVVDTSDQQEEVSTDEEVAADEPAVTDESTETEDVADASGDVADDTSSEAAADAEPEEVADEKVAEKPKKAPAKKPAATKSAPKKVAEAKPSATKAKKAK